LDEAKPQDLSLAFLREFMNLPNTYFDPGAPMKYRKYKIYVMSLDLFRVQHFPALPLDFVPW